MTDTSKRTGWRFAIFLFPMPQKFQGSAVFWISSLKISHIDGTAEVGLFNGIATWSVYAINTVALFCRTGLLFCKAPSLNPSPLTSSMWTVLLTERTSKKHSPNIYIPTRHHGGCLVLSVCFMYKQNSAWTPMSYIPPGIFPNQNM